MRRRRNQNGLLLTAVIATSFWSLTSVGLLYCFFIFIPKSPRSDRLEPVQFATSTRLLLGHFAGNRHSRNGSQFLLFDQSRLRVRLLHGYPPTYTLTVQIFRLAEVAPVRTITSLLSSKGIGDPESYRQPAGLLTTAVMTASFWFLTSVGFV
jgi:hypothetical protein